MIWLTRSRHPKDHCPYCRKDMYTPEEMSKAALEVLGEQRVGELRDFEKANNLDNNLNEANIESEINSSVDAR